jgi:serine/threonine-protein kinase PRP4
MSPSASEGEIVEATSAQSPERNMHIDRRYRHSTSSTGSHRSRSRSRSRSPYQHGTKRRRDDYPSRDGRDTRRFKVHYEDKGSRRTNHHRHSRSRSRSPYRHQSTSQTLEASKHVKTAPIRTVRFHDNGDSNAKSSRAPEQEPTEPINIEPIDEATQIEERRKRREALKAKLNSQPTPLLAQALHASTNSVPSTPYQPETPTGKSYAIPLSTQSLTTYVESPLVMSPQTPSFTNSPRPRDDPDEPSAADYDPTADMQEDRARHDHRFQQETKVQSSHVEVQAPSAKNEDKDEFDMFADDDDDDTLVPILAKNKPKASDVMQSKDSNANLVDNWDDIDGYYRIVLGELLDGRYHVQANLGKGMFSAVVRALDQSTNKLVAIKVIRSQESMKKAGLKEIDILQKLAEADPTDKQHLIRLERYFEHKGHLCMVFENLHINLREVLKKYGRDVGINFRAVRLYAQQMFLALSLLKKCNILHADLKPDNVLINEERNMLKVCDLGSAGDASENDITPYLVSRFYRAPEIILGMPYDFGIDMWSIGCTLYELYTGKILFMGRNNNQMLKSIMECRGKFSLKLLKKAEFAGLHFDDNLQFRSMEKDKVTNKDVVRMLSINRPTRDLKSRLVRATKNVTEAEAKELPLFIDLLDRCLALNPEKRLTPTDALKHPFINRTKI